MRSVEPRSRSQEPPELRDPRSVTEFHGGDILSGEFDALVTVAPSVVPNHEEAEAAGDSAADSAEDGRHDERR